MWKDEEAKQNKLNFRTKGRNGQRIKKEAKAEKGKKISVRS